MINLFRIWLNCSFCLFRIELNCLIYLSLNVHNIVLYHTLLIKIIFSPSIVNFFCLTLNFTWSRKQNLKFELFAILKIMSAKHLATCVEKQMTLEFCLNYGKLATLPKRLTWGRTKLIQQKKEFPPVGTGPQTSLVFTQMPHWLSLFDIWLSVWIFESFICLICYH